MDKPTEITFIQLINENAGIAHRICRIYFPESDDRDDAFQEMMYQLWKAFPAFGGRSKFSTWMYSVCLNTALTYQKKNKLRKVEAISSEHYQIAETQHNTNEENRSLLFDAITLLSPLNKAIVLLYLEDMSYDEIAEITGITKANVSVRLVRIKRELEENLKK